MKLGILNDIHEHVEFLDRALARLRLEDVDRIVFLGDLFDSGERFHEAGTRLIEAGAVGVWGNHEIGLCLDPHESLTATYAGPGLDFLATLQPRMELEDCLLSHVLPQHDPTDLSQPWYLERPPRTLEETSRLFAAAPQRVMFAGHYHRWLAVNESGPLEWDGTAPIRLAPPSRWFVIVHALCDGCCATYDTDTGWLVPIDLKNEEADRVGTRARPSPLATHVPMDLTVAEDAPEDLLDRLRDRSERIDRHSEETLQRLVARFPAERLREALTGRLDDLRGPHGAVVLRLLEAYANDDLLSELADSLEAHGEELPPERLWEALELLQGTGLIDDRPGLTALWDELNDLIDAGDAPIAELATQLEDDPDSVWTALEGLKPVEPDVRAEIIAGLAHQPAGPGLLEFLRLLAIGPDATTRRAAVEALLTLDLARPVVAEVLARLANEHPDPSVGRRVAARLGQPIGSALRSPGALLSAHPRLLGSRVTALDERGRGVIALLTENRGELVGAAFLCNVLAGVADVSGLFGRDLAETRQVLLESVGTSLAFVDDDHALALGLLAGNLTLIGPSTSPALPYWLERTAGAGFRPRPFALEPMGPDRGPEALAFDEVRARALDVLDACPGWVDDSDLTYEIAEELLLRDGGAPPDPVRDSGAFRFLFEGRARARLELDIRMLSWMSAFWSSNGEPDRARSAAAMAWQLSDAQHVVPGHPYIIELMTRSLMTAQDDLKRGIDLRDPTIRARRSRIAWP